MVSYLEKAPIMKKLKKSIWLALLYSLSLFSETLTLEVAIEDALKHHPDLKSLKLKVKQSKIFYKTAFSDYLPQLSLQANYNLTQTYVLPQNGAFNTIDDSGWNAGVNLKQKIWDFSKTSSLVDASKIDESVAYLSLKDAQALLSYKVKSLYELMVVQKEAIGVREKDLEAKEAYYKQALALVKQGLKTNADASRFLSSVYIAKENLAIAEASFQKAKNSLSLYIGREIADDVLLQKDVLEQNLKQKERIEKSILSQNYQLQIASQNIVKNTLLHKASKASRFGSIDGIASYTHFDTLNAYDAKVLGLTLNIPLYSGGRTSSEIQQIQIASKISKEQQVSKILALKEELESLIIDIKRYNKSIEAKYAQEKSAQETLNLLSGRYDEGLSTYIEVLDASSLVLNAKLGLLESYYLKSVAINRLYYLQGKIK